MPLFIQNTMIISKKDLFPLLKTVLPENPLIIEAGAFNGKDTLLLSKQWPNGVIHSFEPVPEIFTLLEKNTQNCPNVHLYPTALSDRNGFQEFYVSEHPKKPGQPCQAGTVKKPLERLAWSPISYPKTIMVPTITLDTWAQQNNVDSIDFAWLDLQGNELTLLQASNHMIQRISALFMEVNFINAYEGQTSYAQTVIWLESHGFKVIAQDFAETSTWFFGNILVFKV